MPQGNWARAPQLLSLHSRVRELQLLKPLAYSLRSTREATATRGLHTTARESPHAATKTQHSQKI